MAYISRECLKDQQTNKFVNTAYLLHLIAQLILSRTSGGKRKERKSSLGEVGSNRNGERVKIGICDRTEATTSWIYLFIWYLLKMAARLTHIRLIRKDEYQYQ